MADDNLGQRTATKASWTKIFSGFRVALDIKKLLLAAAGILVMAAGWWMLAVVFYGSRREPLPEEYIGTAADSKEKDAERIKAGWESFQVARKRFNLLHRLAGTAPMPQDEGDVAQSYQEYESMKGMRTAVQNAQMVLTVGKEKSEKGENYYLLLGKTKIYVTGDVAKLNEGAKIRVPDVILGDEKQQTIVIVNGPTLTVATNYKELKEIREGAKDLLVLEREARGNPDKQSALDKLRLLLGKPALKPAGLLRTWPWFEDRGPNPYLVATGMLTEERPLDTGRSAFVSWMGVLLEPLVKMLSPIAYFFHEGAGGWNRIYLILVILWTLATWGFFGGAITRMAAVQVARGEKVSLREALGFARERFQSFFSAPVFPLLFLGILTFFLVLFGLFSGLIPIVGDVFLSGLLWPIVVILGLVMAVVLVGLVGWPMMNATISSEGSDSFDALSRSYSYVYQAPWHYLWYGVVALAYGAALVFFVGLMGSLMVYLGSWGIRQAPFLAGTPENDRQPHFLFVRAPTSFGWRDLLLHDSTHAVRVTDVDQRGMPVQHYAMSEKYMESMKVYNWIGTYLVTAWLYILFLLIVGFGYSYFWTASTIIYLLMRNKVDDTDLDEIHLEEEETEDYFTRDMTTAAPATPAAPTPAPGGGVMVDAPTLRTPPPPATPASTAAAAPAAASKVTQLAPPEASTGEPPPPSDGSSSSPAPNP